MLLRMVKISWSRSYIRLIISTIFCYKKKKITNSTYINISAQDMLRCLQSYSPPSFGYKEKHNSLPSTYLYISLVVVKMFLLYENKNDTVTGGYTLISRQASTAHSYISGFNDDLKQYFTALFIIFFVSRSYRIEIPNCVSYTK